MTHWIMGFILIGVVVFFCVAAWMDRDNDDCDVAPSYLYPLEHIELCDAPIDYEQHPDWVS